MKYLALLFIACGFAINAQDTRLSDFGTDGKIIDSVTNSSNSSARELEVYRNNIYTLSSGGYNSLGIFSYDQSGDPNNDFSGDGKAELTSMNGADNPKFTISANGEIYIAVCSMSVMTVVKMDMSGTLVNSFGTGGKLNVPITATRVADLVVRGNTLIIGGNNYNSFFVVHLNTSDGSLDASFDGDGQANISFVNDSPYAYGMDSDGSGNIYLFGYIYYFSGVQSGVVAKFTNTGADTTFGNLGVTNAPTGVSEFQTGKVSGSTIYAAGGYSAAFLAAFDTNSGDVITSFGTNGAVIVGNTTSTVNESFRTILITEDGEILVAGNQALNVPPYDSDAIYYLFTSSGSPVTDYGNNGSIIDSSTVNETVYCLEIYNGYDILAGGSSGAKFFITYFYEEGATPDFPTGFSPNDDGFNDYLMVRNLYAATNNTLVVYDREGNRVYKTEDYKNDWKGLNDNEKPLSDGVYYYVFTYNKSKKIKNFIEIRR